MVISRRILDVAYQLDGLRLAEAAVPTVTLPPRHAAPAETATEIVPIESLLYDESKSLDEAPVVPIESLAPEPEPAAGASPIPPSGLERSYTTYDRLRRELPRVPPSLEQLMGATPPPLQQAISAPVEEAVETIEIGLLCYRGRAALERAAAVRQQLADELQKHGGLESSIQPLLQELLDLVPLALVEQ